MLSDALVPQMKLLALADLHADEQALDRLRAVAARNDYDAVLFAGDITSANGPVSYAIELLGLFPQNGYFIHGNSDGKAVQSALKSHPHYVHGKKIQLGSWNLVGWGGSPPTPFRTVCEYSEAEIEEGLAKAGVDKYSILMTHAPPFGFFDSVAGQGQRLGHAGSIAIRKAVEKQQPLLCLFGHVHETTGSMLYKETMMVKLPPAQSLMATEITITDTIKVTNIRL